MKKFIWASYPNNPYFARYTVSIFGDLCDYSCDKIVEWFKNKCKLIDSDNVPGGSIIQATITVSNECGGAKSYTYKKEEDEKEDPYYQAVSTAIVAIREQICTNNGGQIIYLVVESEDK